MDDGFLGTAPVKTFKPNGYGLYQMIGNVWEWCINPAQIPLKDFKKYSPEYYRENYSEYSDNNFATKGGSFLCHSSYCNRYRVAARNKSSGSTSTSNIGFRCVR